MRYWLNSHHPVEKGRSRDAWNGVYLKEQHTNTLMKRIKPGDVAVIYEIDWKEGDAVRVDNQDIQLRKGRKGITAIVEVVGSFVGEKYEFDGDAYIGHFDTKTIKGSISDNPLVPLQQLKEAWLAEFGKEFNPRINGGLRELSPEEWQVISRLVGFHE